MEGRPNDNLDLGIKKTGLLLVAQKLEKKGIVTIEDVDIFLEELDLPEIPDEQIIKECLDSGGSQFGFLTLESFFTFVVRHLRDVTPKECINAFQVFDEEDTGFIDFRFLSEVVGNLGDKMDAEDVDALVTVSELDEQGALNYDEALKTSLNVMMEAEMKDILEEG